MKRIVVSSAVLALAVAGISQAHAAPAQYKVTGGGQIITEAASGPGDTIAFTAQSAPTASQDDAARGQLQYNGRTQTDAPKFHGTVTCLQVDGATARIAGTYTNAAGSAGFFRLLIDDTDQGASQNGTELLTFNPNASSADCAQMNGDDAQDQLGRGNIVIHNAKA